MSDDIKNEEENLDEQVEQNEDVNLGGDLEKSEDLPREQEDSEDHYGEFEESQSEEAGSESMNDNNREEWRNTEVEPSSGDEKKQTPKKMDNKVIFGIAAAVVVVVVLLIVLIVQNGKKTSPNTVSENTTTTAAVTTPNPTEGLVEITPPPTTTAPTGINTEDGTPVATLADQVISKSDFKYFFDYMKNSMLSSFGIEPGSEDEAMFWEETFDGVNKTIDYARESTLSELANMKMCIEIAGERGIVLDDADMENFNSSMQMQIDSVGGEAELEMLLQQDVGITFDEYKALYQQFMLREKLFNIEKEKITVTDEEMRTYYEENKENYDTVTVRHILYLNEGVDTANPRTKEESKQLADDMLKRVEAGEDMKSLADEFSEDTGVTYNSGEYTFTRNDNYVAEFITWGFSSAIGDTGVIETTYGYHVMKKEGATTETFENVSSSISELLKNEALNAIITEWSADPKYELKVNEEVLRSFS